MMPKTLTRELAYNNSLCLRLDEFVRAPFDRGMQMRGVRLCPTGIAGSYEIWFQEHSLGAVDCNEDGFIAGVVIFVGATDHGSGPLKPEAALIEQEFVGKKLFPRLEV